MAARRVPGDGRRDRSCGGPVEHHVMARCPGAEEPELVDVARTRRRARRIAREAERSYGPDAVVGYYTFKARRSQ